MPTEQQIIDLRNELDALAAEIGDDCAALATLMEQRRAARENVESSRAELLDDILNQRFAVNNKLQFTNDAQRQIELTRREKTDAPHVALVAALNSKMTSEGNLEATIEEKRRLHKSKSLLLEFYVRAIGGASGGDLFPFDGKATSAEEFAAFAPGSFNAAKYIINGLSKLVRIGNKATEFIYKNYGPEGSGENSWVLNANYPDNQTGFNLAQLDIESSNDRTTAALEANTENGFAQLRAQCETGIGGVVTIIGQNEINHTSAAHKFDSDEQGHASFSDVAAANETPLSLYIGNILVRVVVGAPDSGGAGFRTLRIPNGV